MSRTHRRHSFRRSKRWNPRRRRNPSHDADFVKHLRDGGRVEVWMDGEVCVYDSMDRDMDDYYLKPHEVPRFIAELKEAKPFAAWHHYEKDSVKHDGFAMQGRGSRNPVFMNPRGRRRGGSRFTKHRRGRKWESAVHGSLPHWVNPYKVDYYMEREIRGARRAKRLGRKARSGLRRRSGKHIAGLLVGSFNPGRRGRGRGFGRRGGLRSAPSIRDWQGFQRIRGLMKGNPRRDGSRSRSGRKAAESVARKLARRAQDAVDLCVLVRDETGHEMTLKRAARIMGSVR